MTEPMTEEQIKKEVEARVAEGERLWPRKPEEKKEITSSLIEGCIGANEYGDGVLFAESHRDKLIFDHSRDEWLRWGGHSWFKDNSEFALACIEDVVDLLLQEAERITGWISTAVKKSDDQQQKHLERRREAIYKRVQRLRSDKGRVAALKFARSCRDSISTAGEGFDANPYLLGCANGVIDLQTGECRPGRQADFITRASPIEWHGLDEPAPTFIERMLEIMSDDPELVECLQRIFGMGIIGHSEERRFICFHGPEGSNGKGVIARIVMGVAGPLAGPIPTEMLIDQGRARSSAAPSPDILSLKGLRIAFASEADENRSFSPSRLKWLSGNDTLVGRYLNQNELIRFKPSHHLFLLTNERPHAPHHDKAFWERLVMIPFSRSFVSSPSAPHERPLRLGIDEELQREASGILAWLVRGALLYQASGLIYPKKVLEAKADYKTTEDPLGGWIEDNIELNDQAVETFADLYRDYTEWYEKNVSAKNVPKSTRLGSLLVKRFERTPGNPRSYRGLRIK